MPDPSVCGFVFATQAIPHFQRGSPKRNFFAIPAYLLFDYWQEQRVGDG